MARRAQASITIAIKKARKDYAHVFDSDLPTDHARPRTRAECQRGPRPCPFVGCRYHLYLDVNPETGSIKLNFPTLRPDEMVESCALDVAAGTGNTLEEVGRMMELTRERVRQIEAKALARLVDQFGENLCEELLLAGLTLEDWFLR